jgi:G2/mitotic-specific cyclin-B, other
MDAMRAARKPSDGDVTKRPSVRRKPLGDITNRETTSSTANAEKLPREVAPTRSATADTLPPCASTSDILITEALPDEPQMDVQDFNDRPYMNREIDDIDARDAENALLCASYVDTMYQNFWDTEQEFKVNSEYMSHQPFINERMRTVLIDWLVEVHLKFKMVPETLYLTVNVIDRYLEKHEVRRSKLQLVGVSALLIASKYEEIYPPELQDLVFVTDRAYSAREIIETEGVLMKALDYQLTVPTIHTFLCRYLKAAHADRTMVQMACYLAERSLQEYSSLKYPPSLIAAKAIHCARMSLRRHPWSPTLVHYTRYDEPDMEACGNDMRDYLRAAAAAAAASAAGSSVTQYTAVARKYSGSKFGSVARMPITV